MLSPINTAVNIKITQIKVHPEKTLPITAPVIVACIELTRNVPKVTIIAKSNKIIGNFLSLFFIFKKCR